MKRIGFYAARIACRLASRVQNLSDGFAGANTDNAEGQSAAVTDDLSTRLIDRKGRAPHHYVLLSPPTAGCMQTDRPVLESTCVSSRGEARNEKPPTPVENGAGVVCPLVRVVHAPELRKKEARHLSLGDADTGPCAARGGVAEETTTHSNMNIKIASRGSGRVAGLAISAPLQAGPAFHLADLRAVAGAHSPANDLGEGQPLCSGFVEQLLQDIGGPRDGDTRAPHWLLDAVLKAP